MASTHPTHRKPTGKALWAGVTLLVLIIAALSAVWFFITVGEIRENKSELGGSHRAELTETAQTAHPS